MPNAKHRIKKIIIKLRITQNHIKGQLYFNEYFNEPHMP